MKSLWGDPNRGFDVATGVPIAAEASSSVGERSAPSGALSKLRQTLLACTTVCNGFTLPIWGTGQVD